MTDDTAADPSALTFGPPCFNPASAHPLRLRCVIMKLSPRMHRTLVEAVRRSEHGEALHATEEWQPPDGGYERVLWSTAHGLRSRGLVTFRKVTDEWYEPVTDAVGNQTSRFHPALHALVPTPHGRAVLAAADYKKAWHKKARRRWRAAPPPRPAPQRR